MLSFFVSTGSRVEGRKRRRSYGLRGSRQYQGCPIHRWLGEKVIFSAEALRQVVELEAFAEHDKGKVRKGARLRLFPSMRA